MNFAVIDASLVVDTVTKSISYSRSTNHSMDLALI